MTDTRYFCVTGMHRSGTSAVARVANLLGASLGPEKGLLGALPQNERGFWENVQLKELNEELLLALGGSWDRPPDLEPGWEDDSSLEPLKAKGLALLQSLSADSEVFIWKDPRNSLTLPFWRSVVPIEGTMLALRHPSAVASSLTARNQMDREVAASLWLRYTACAWTADPGTLVVTYESLVDDTARVAGELASFLGVDDPDAEQLAEIGGFVTPDLRHHAPAVSDAGPVERLAVETFESIAGGRGEDIQSLLEVVAVSGLSMVAGLPQTAARLETEGRLDDFRDRLEAARTRSRELKAELEAAKAKTRDLRGELESAKTRSRELREELEAARVKSRDERAKLAAANNARALVEEDLAEAQGRIMALEYEVLEKAALERDLAAATREYDRLRNRRVVRAGLGLAGLARPIFRLRRGQLGKQRAKSGKKSSQANKGGGQTSPVKKRGGSAPAKQPASKAAGNASSSVEPAEQVEAIAPKLELFTVLPPVSIVIPVYGALDELRKCVDSVIRNTAGNCELVLVDDASPEPEVGRYLAELETSYTHVRVLTNEVNLGFVGTVNRGFASTESDVVILNSDTQVPPGWVGRLQRIAYTDPTIGTVTPLSDNAGAFSAPVRGVPNEMPREIDEMGRLVLHHSENLVPGAPTGNGFCMYFKRELLDDTGGFDAEAFPRGYGEENDLSMRASRLGWRHVIDDSTIVFHVRSASFKEEKAELLARGRAKLDELHPDYGRLVKEFLRDPVMERARQNVKSAVIAGETGSHGLPRVLYAMHSGRGGTPMTNEDLMSAVSSRYEPLLLLCDGKSIVLRDGATGAVMEEIKLNERITPEMFTSAEYRSVVGRILERYGVELVHVRHLQRHTFDLPEIAQVLGIPVVMSFHDFHYICPSVHLLDESDRYCAGICTPGQGLCRTPAWFKGIPHLKHGWVKVWQERAREMFRHVDAFVTTSPSAAEVYTSIFDELGGGRLEIIEHGRNLEQQPSVARFPEPDEPARVLLLGHIGVHKGAELVAEIESLDTAGRLEFHLLGTFTKSVETDLVDHGSYSREDVHSGVAAIRPAVIALLSIWPETYSHTLTEAWSLGVPVVGSDLGAVRDRINTHGGGWTVDVSSAKAVYESMVEIISDEEEWERQRGLASIAGLPDVAGMAGRYTDLYERVADRHRPFHMVGSA